MSRHEIPLSRKTTLILRNQVSSALFAFCGEFDGKTFPAGNLTFVWVGWGSVRLKLIFFFFFGAKVASSCKHLFGRDGGVLIKEEI